MVAAEIDFCKGHAKLSPLSPPGRPKIPPCQKTPKILCVLTPENYAAQAVRASWWFFLW